MDFEKIRLETVETLISELNKNSEDDAFSNLTEVIIKISSRVSKTMFEKYHEQLDRTK